MGKSTGDPTQPEHIEPQIDLVGDIGTGPDVLDDVAFSANKPDYSGISTNELQSSLQDAVDELRQALTSGFEADVVSITAMIASRSPADEAADLLHDADAQIADAEAGSKAVGDDRVFELRVLRMRIQGLLDELSARAAAAPAVAPAAGAQPSKAGPSMSTPSTSVPSTSVPSTTVPSAPVVGAGGPGVKPAASGLGGVAIRYFVAGIVIAVLAGAGIIALGGNGQVPVAASLPPTSAPTAAPGTQPAATTPVVVATAGPPQTPAAVTAAPGGLIFAPFEITADVKVDKCEHRYTVRFTVQDSTSQSTAFAGKTAVFHLLDNEADRTAIIGADGTFTAEVDEHFEKTGSGCFSHLQPKVLTVDGHPVFG